MRSTRLKGAGKRHIMRTPAIVRATVTGILTTNCIVPSRARVDSTWHRQP